MLSATYRDSRPTQRTRTAISMPADGRGFIAGQTGTGKTTLASVILRPMLHVVIIDPKRQYQPERAAAVANSPEEINRHRRAEWILYQPDPEFDSIDQYDRVCEWIYRRERTFVYIDELGAMVTPHQWPHYLKALYQQGRGLGIGILAVSQRPFSVPLFSLTESEQKWKFYLAMEQDQDRMAEYMGREVLEPKTFPTDTVHPDFHGFWYAARDERRAAQYHVLRLE